MIKTNTKFDLKFPKLFIRDDLKKIAERYIVPVMQSNIDNEIALDEKPLPALEPATVRRKIRKGLSPKILTETGWLRTSFVVTTPDDSTVKITLKPERYLIGTYLQIEGIASKKGVKYFNFFGISTRMELNAVEYMRKRIREAIRNGRK